MNKANIRPTSDLADKLVYSFGDGAAEGKGSMRDLLGGKGANLAEMCSLGLPVPPGFTITTEVCVDYYKQGKEMHPALEAQVQTALAEIEKKVGAQFGDAKNPLLVSVRSGARASMPGMMDTVLNLGLNDATVEALAAKTGNPRFAYDSYRRFIQMYSDVVLELDHYHFEEMLDEKKRDREIELDTELTAEDLKSLVAAYKERVEVELGHSFPQDVHEQLWGAIKAVFNSWMNPRANTYRKLHDIPESWGTAVTVQSMVFGNMGDDCATGVAFTRNPSTGEHKYYGEFLVNAQGEDVVAGIRTPLPLDEMPAVMPEVYKQLTAVFDKLEAHYRDMQDIEFTIQNNKLWMLQTRNGKRTAAAAVKIAVDMVGEKRISEQDALKRIDPLSLDQLLHPTLDPKAKKTVITRGLPASPGAAFGKIVFTAEDAEAMAQDHKEKVILVRIETSPEDIHGMHAAQGILTARGGMTSHAAVVARGMGKPCVSGAGELKIDYAKKTLQVGTHSLKEGDLITINGGTGEVMLGGVATVQPQLSADFETLMGWADKVRKLKVRTNAETPADAEVARKFGAEGIGLCRTEHMFFDAERIIAMREMIVAGNTEGRQAALAKLLPMQRKDFAELFTIMQGLPVTIRLLDPPLHEFLPHTDEDIKQVAKAAGVSVEQVRHRSHTLKEQNPMLGHRGCRLGITYPEIYAMQARAIFEAAAEVGNVTPEIMIPLVMMSKELEILKALVDDTAAAVMQEKNVKIEYQVGTMIELPRAALRAGEIAQAAEFFSFGTNDLTQTTLGISRDDSAGFIEAYKEQHIVEQDPFVTLDQSGVGELIELAVKRGRETRPGIKLGICGEHGGDPASIAFCQKVGLDYVSCSPYRVPVAKLAAAQGSIVVKVMARFTIGVVRETRKGDRRVALVPEVIARLTSHYPNMFNFLIEGGAGENAGFSDEAYRQAGAQVVAREDVNKYADLLLWVKRPRDDFKEPESFSEGKCVAGFLEPLADDGHISTMTRAKLTALTFEQLPPGKETAEMDAFAAMGRLAGVVALDEAIAKLAIKLPQEKPRVLIIGTGNAGLEAAEKAIHRGYDVAILASSDLRRKAILHRPRHKGQQVEFHCHNTSRGSTDRFAKLAEAFKPNIVLCTAHRQGEMAPKIINDHGFDALPDRCIVEDLTVSIGGNSSELPCTDESKQLERGIHISNRSNYPSARPDEASRAYAICMEHMLSHLATHIKPSQSIGEFLAGDCVLGKAVITHAGKPCKSQNAGISRSFIQGVLSRYSAAQGR